MKAQEDEMEQEMESLIEELEELDAKNNKPREKLWRRRERMTRLPVRLGRFVEKIEALLLSQMQHSRMVDGIGDGRGFRCGTLECRTIEQ